MRRGEAVLGRMAVLDAGGDGACLFCKRHRGAFVGVEVGNDPAATMDVDDHGQSPLPPGGV